MKYRVWDKVETKFVDNILVCTNGELERKFDGTCSRTFPTLERYIVSKYTEFKDISGKRIFEGDLIKFTPEIIGDEFFDNKIGKVEYSECAFWLNFGDVAIPLWSETKRYEIHGNIYENPELLEGV